MERYGTLKRSKLHLLTWLVESRPDMCGPIRVVRSGLLDMARGDHGNEVQHEWVGDGDDQLHLMVEVGGSK